MKSRGSFTKGSISFTKITQSTREVSTDAQQRLTSALHRAIADPDVRKALSDPLDFENATTECQKVKRPLKVQGAPSEE